jgi:hypothetical protein
MRILRVAIRKQKMEIAQVFDFPYSKVVWPLMHMINAQNIDR